MNRQWTKEQREALRRQRLGSKNPNWKGEECSRRGGGDRARRLYREHRPCAVCGASKGERHHKDGNTLNNNPENILFLCRKHHMENDGRLGKLTQYARENKIGVKGGFAKAAILRIAIGNGAQLNKRSSNNTSGYRGVCWDKSRNKWTAYIGVNHKTINLGRFDSPQSAHEAYKEAALKYYGNVLGNDERRIFE